MTNDAAAFDLGADSHRGAPPLPLQAMHEHYLKRELIRIQLTHELDVLRDLSTIGLLGPPFRPPGTETALPADASVPILRHVFQQHVLTFPFLEAGLDQKGTPTSKHFWQDTVQQFLEILGSKDISSSEDREEATKRRRISNKLTTLISIYMSSGLQTTNPLEKTAKIEGAATRTATASAATDRAQSNGAALAKSGVQNIDAAGLARELLDAPNFINGVDINVVGVKLVKSKKKSALAGLFMVPDEHAEFIIRARMTHPDYRSNEAEDSEHNAQLLKDTPVIYVARRFSDFASLGSKLAKELVGVELPKLPSKNKSSLSLQGDEAAIQSANSANPFQNEEDDDDFDLEEEKEDLGTQFKSKLQFGATAPTSNSSTIKLPRERQRVSVRAYLRELLAVPAVSKSQTFLEFLFRDQLRSLSPGEHEDIGRRRAMDVKRVEDQLEFLRMATLRARELEEHMTEFKQDMMRPDGLQRIFAELREKSYIDDLSPRFQIFLQWAAVEFSASLYSMFVAGDSSTDLFSQISRIHKLMPYSVLRGILRWSNPVAIMKGVIDLFLAQPFGKRSLLQNIFYLVLADDIKAQDKQIAVLKRGLALSDPRHADVIETVINAYLQASWSVREEIRSTARGHDEHDEDGHSELLVAIFKHSRMLVPDGGILQDEVSLLVEAWYEAWNAAVERTRGSNAASNYPEDYVAAYTTTKELLKHLMRRNDKNQLQELWNESTTMSLLREVFTIFYSPLVEVFKSAKVYEAVADFENFMDDLIKVVHRAEASALTRGPNEVVDDFIALCNRHMHPLYRFVHEMYINDKGLFFDGLLQWLTGIVQFLRFGTVESRLGADSKVDLNAIVEFAAQQPDGVDPVKLVAEIQKLVEWLEARRAWVAEQAQHAQSLSKAAGKRRSMDGLDWQQAMPISDELNGAAFGIAEVRIRF